MRLRTRTHELCIGCLIQHILGKSISHTSLMYSVHALLLLYIYSYICTPTPEYLLLYLHSYSCTLTPGTPTPALLLVHSYYYTPIPALLFLYSFYSSHIPALLFLYSDYYTPIPALIYLYSYSFASIPAILLFFK